MESEEDAAFRRGNPESRIQKGARALALALVCCAAAFGLDTSKLKPNGYVNDFAGVLDEGSKTGLERYCADVEKSTGAQMAVVTISSLDGEPIEDVANQLYREWGIGKKGKDEGVLLLLSTKDRKSRIEVGYGLEPVIPDAVAGDVLRDMRPSLREGNYGSALQAGAAAIGERIAQSKGVTIQRTMPRRAAPDPSGPGIPAPFVILGLFLLFFLLSRGGGGGGFLTGMVLGNMMGRRGPWGGGGGWGGGGFGGGDSGGGGWGGFGGGDSGGGGASSNW